MTTNIIRFAFLFLLVTLFLGSSNKQAEIDSAWRVQKVTMDGVDDDWEDTPFHYDDESRLRINVTNDESYLYLLIAAPGRGFGHHILNRGLTIWFDPTGGSSHTFGIQTTGNDLQAGRSPEKYLSDSGRPPIQPESGRSSEGGNDSRPGPDAATYRLLPDVNILGAENQLVDYCRMKDVSKWHMEAMLGTPQGRVVFELRVPLKKTADTPYAISADGASKIISIGIVAENLEMDALKDSGPLSRPTEPRGAVGGKGRIPSDRLSGAEHRYSRGGEPGKTAKTSSSYELWVKIHLSGGAPGSKNTGN
jgi:hypothetical protein